MESSAIGRSYSGKHLNLLKADLTRRGMQVSLEGFGYNTTDSKRLIMVRHDLRRNILVEKHDVPTTRHVGINEMVDPIKCAYWWRDLAAIVIAYVRSCSVCQHMEPYNLKKAGKRTLLPSMRAHCIKSPPTWSLIHQSPADGTNAWKI